MLLNMAVNDILPPGSLEVDDLIKEIMTIRKENARSAEKYKDITFEDILNTNHEGWQELAANDAIKEKINMYAVKKMEEALESTLLIDCDGDTELEKIASEKITNLKNTIEENLQNEVQLQFIH
jgi:hypothetical protein